MHNNSAYLNSNMVELVDTEQPLLVTDCSTCYLKHQPLKHTCRPNGCSDYQILYISSGKIHFLFDGIKQIVPAGSIVLFRPSDSQLYKYFGEEQPKVFCIHFTGFDVERYLREYDLWDNRVIRATASYNWEHLFRRMIHEFQLREDVYSELLVTYLKELLLLLHRQVLKSKPKSQDPPPEIKQAIHYFDENYASDIHIYEYAKEHYISNSRFTQCFKQYTGLSPTHYLLSLRIQNAQSLLENSTYNISEIAFMVGFRDPLYFSRVFKKQVGVSPKHYRSQIMD